MHRRGCHCLASWAAWGSRPVVSWGTPAATGLAVEAACALSVHPGQHSPHLTHCQTHPADGCLAVGTEAGALPVELVSWLWEEEGLQGLELGDGGHPDFHPLPTVPPVVPCNRVQHCLKWRGTAPRSAAAYGQGMRGTEQRTGGRWGHTGHQMQHIAHPGGTAVLGTPVRPGSQYQWERGPQYATVFTNTALTSLEYARLRPWRGSCWLWGGPG